MTLFPSILTPFNGSCVGWLYSCIISIFLPTSCSLLPTGWDLAFCSRIFLPPLPRFSGVITTLLGDSPRGQLCLFASAAHVQCRWHSSSCKPALLCQFTLCSICTWPELHPFRRAWLERCISFCLSSLKRGEDSVLSNVGRCIEVLLVVLASVRVTKVFNFLLARGSFSDGYKRKESRRLFSDFPVL